MKKSKYQKLPKANGTESGLQITKGDQTLTPRQHEMMRVIREWITEHQYPPTFREIAAIVGITTPNGVQGQLRALRAKGLITWSEHHARSISLVNPDPCPYCGCSKQGG